MDTLAGSCIFTTLNLLSDYWQVEVQPEDREKTAVCTSEELFDSNMLPFGLCNAPATLFGQKEVTFLGHIISDEGVAPDPAKVAAITN